MLRTYKQYTVNKGLSTKIIKDEALVEKYKKKGFKVIKTEEIEEEVKDDIVAESK